MRKYLKYLLHNLGIKIIRAPSYGFEYLLNEKRYEKQTVNLSGVPFEIADGHSFYHSHREIFIDEIYKFKSNNSKPRIIDCGSNYGTSIVYFKQLYANSDIIGIEADPYIFKILKKNLDQRSFNNITLLNKVISNEKGPIQFFSEGSDGGRTHTMSESIRTHELEALSLDEIIEGEIDFLKMDIEGAETDVLCSSKKLHMIKQLFIEYHSFVDEKQKLGNLLSCLSKNNFRYYIHTQFCSKKPLMEKGTQLGMDLQLNIFAKRN